MALFGKNWLKIIKSCVSTMRHYRNWPEVIASFARKQFPPRFILRDGTRLEAAGGFKEIWEIEDIFFKRAYLPKPLTIRTDDVVIDIGANVGVFRSLQQNVPAIWSMPLNRSPTIVTSSRTYSPSTTCPKLFCSRWPFQIVLGARLFR